MAGTDVIREPKFFTDDCALIAEMLKSQWSLGPGETPEILYIPEQLAVNARVGYIYVYPMNRSYNISSIDYQNLTVRSTIGIKLSTRFRDKHFLWSGEIIRILLANRRRGPRCLMDYLYLELLGDRQMTDLSGWYSTTFDIRLTTFAKGIRSAGFGDRINNEIADEFDSINGGEGE